jgi:hypothetical protein
MDAAETQRATWTVGVHAWTTVDNVDRYRGRVQKQKQRVTHRYALQLTSRIPTGTFNTLREESIAKGKQFMEDSKDEMTMTKEKWLAIRKETGREIDAETAEVMWEHGQVLDPYGVEAELPAERDCIGRIYFARSPGSDICVCFYDLPDGTRDALWEKDRLGLLRWIDPFEALLELD